MKLITKKTGILLSVIAFIEIISFLGYFYPDLKIISAIVATIIVAIMTFKNLENGLLIMFTELIIGSKGHLLELGPVSIRIIIFTIIILAYLLKLTHKEERAKITSYLKSFKFWPYFLGLAAFILIALANAFIQRNSFANIFSDINAWVFFLLLFPILSVYYQADEKTYRRLAQTITAAFLWLCFETLIILFIFTHNLIVAGELYRWLRITGVAEITNTIGSWPRIFLQSQIYASIALVMIPFLLNIKNKNAWLIMIGAWSVCILSMSRSFWLATAAVLFLSLLGQLIFFGAKNFWSKLLLITASATASVLLIIIIIMIPLSTEQGSFSANSFIERASLDSGEAAIASRWSLLPALWHKVTDHPLIGSGFGSEVTYKSSDPRVLQSNPTGEYTTYAFEWGYLAFWLKLGLFGLLAYLALLVSFIYRGLLKYRQNNILAGALALGALVLVITHFFTPYLDHPLGIGYLVLAAVLMEALPLQKN